MALSAACAAAPADNAAKRESESECHLTADADGERDEPPVATESMIIDHRHTDLKDVPLEWINKAKTDLHIAYGHTSHGSQITTGMSGLVSFANAPNGGSTYAWNNGGTDGALDLRDSPFSGASDLGNPDRTAWANATRTYLDARHAT